MWYVLVIRVGWFSTEASPSQPRQPYSGGQSPIRHGPVALARGRLSAYRSFVSMFDVRSVQLDAVVDMDAAPARCCFNVGQRIYRIPYSALVLQRSCVDTTCTVLSCPVLYKIQYAN